MRVTEEGRYYAVATAWRVFDAESGAVGITVEYSTGSIWTGHEWQASEAAAEGTVWVLKKDGSINSRGVEQLKLLGWTGDFDLADPPSDSPVQIIVRADEYRGERNLRVSWINPGDSNPASGGLAADRATELTNRYGSRIRAILGAAPGGAAKRVAPKAPEVPAAPAKPAGITEPDDDMPF